MGEAPAVVTPLDEHMGLDIARSLDRRGIPVYGIDSDPAIPGRHSRCCRFVLGPDHRRNDGADYVQFLAAFGQALGRKAVLYPLSDAHVILISRHRDTLQRYYAYVMPEHPTIERLLTKDGLEGIARECQIPSPQTRVAGGPDEIEGIARAMTYPAILKPTESTYWHTQEITKLLRVGVLAGRAKVILCQGPDELLKAYHSIAAYDRRMIVQEVIPGEDSRLAYFSFYLDRQSQPLGLFAGRKHRVLPTGFGSASYARSCHDPELIELGLKLLSAARYQGLGGIEFKKDPRDERYKLIEVNTRFGMWDGLGARCGVDLAYLAYRDALRLPAEPQLSYRAGVTWIDWQRDVRASLAYWREGQLSAGQWLRSLRGEKMWAIYSRGDWRPGAAFTRALLARLGERIAARARGL